MALQFDPTKSFDDNLLIFLSHLAASNPQMATLFRDQIESLKNADTEEKRRSARTQFNATINSKLDPPPPAGVA